MQTVEIIPAILESSFGDIESKLSVLSGIAPVLQIDVVDGAFASSITWPFSKTDSIKTFEEEAMHFFSNSIQLEFDLMVTDPAKEIDRFISIGASRVVIHAKSSTAKEAILKVSSISNRKMQTGLAVQSFEEILNFQELLSYISYIQVMGIEHVGLQGQSFNIKALKTIEQIKNEYQHLSIQVDGGIRRDTMQKVITAGATRLVIGSAIFSSSNPVQEYLKFTDMISIV